MKIHSDFSISYLGVQYVGVARIVVHDLQATYVYLKLRAAQYRVEIKPLQQLLAVAHLVVVE